MRRHARSEGNSKKILRRIREGEEEEVGFSAEIGSRVFPLRTPPPAAPASMPTAGTRRSTRVFVKPSTAYSDDAEPARILRSGRKLFASMPKDSWMRAVDSAADGEGSDLHWWKNKWAEPEIKMKKKKEKEKVEEDRKYGIVYSRKRLRSSSLPEGGGKDRKYGIVFTRKHKRKAGKKLPFLAGESRTEARLVESELLASASNCFTQTLGIESYLWSGSYGDMPVLLVLVESSRGHSSSRFGQILVSIMNWMRRMRFNFWDLAAFVSSGVIAGVFAANGIHFLAVRNRKNNILARNSVPGYGLCKIFGGTEAAPLISLNYSSIPHFFKSLHAARNLASFYISAFLPREHFTCSYEKNSGLVPCEEHDTSFSSEMDGFKTGITVSEIPDVKSNGMMRIIALPAQNQPSMTAVNGYGSNGTKFRRHKKTRSSLRNSRVRNPSLMNSRFGPFVSHQNNGFASSASKIDFTVVPASVKPLDTCLPDLFDSREESDVASSPGSHSKLSALDRKKTPIEKIKEFRSALAEVRQNINSACCKANILVTDTDRCWREDDAEVMLEMLDSQEWFIVVKRMGMVRHLHKPQDLKPCVFNRLTQAYIWSGDDGWKLEFCDKWDWYVFKELHIECRERNTQEMPVKVIPVPGVRVVSGYEDEAEPSFVRPDMYIHMVADEVDRALSSEIACYDMDTGDEEWLRQLNSSSLNTEEVEEGSSSISEESFEKIIFTLERNAYTGADDTSNKERSLDLCQGIWKRDMASVVYDYWLKKRKQKHAALVRVFQGPTLKKAQLLHKPFLRKKRSFKRQRSQVDRFQAGKGKAFLLLQAEREAQKVQEAENVANQAAEVAIQLRTRAQKLIVNADLAVYRSSMALRISETIRASSSSSSSEAPDLDASIFFD